LGVNISIYFSIAEVNMHEIELREISDTSYVR